MAKDHYIPAAVLGRFSQEVTSPARSRFLFVGRADRIFRTKASELGAVNNLYSVLQSPDWSPGGEVDSVDGFLSGYEPLLPAALDTLEAGGSIALSPWLRVLVPYVASLFVRGPEFSERFESRAVVRASGVSRTDNTHGGRIIEFQRLLAPVMCARWVVLTAEGDEPFITNNLGVMLTQDLGTGDEGYAVPVGSHTVLGVFPRDRRDVATFNDGWHAVIEKRLLRANEVAVFNEAMARTATEWVAGASRDVLEHNVGFMPIAPSPSQMTMERWPTEYKAQVAHATEWHRLVSATAGDPTPSQIQDLQTIDANALAQEWCPPLTLVLNMREMPTGLRLTGDDIWLDMAIPQNYKGYFTD